VNCFYEFGPDRTTMVLRADSEWVRLDAGASSLLWPSLYTCMQGMLESRANAVVSLPASPSPIVDA